MDELEIGRPALAVVGMQNDFVDRDVGSYAIGAERRENGAEMPAHGIMLRGQ